MTSASMCAADAFVENKNPPLETGAGRRRRGGGDVDVETGRGAGAAAAAEGDDGGDGGGGGNGHGSGGGEVGFIYEKGGEGDLYGVAVSVFFDLYCVVR